MNITLRVDKTNCRGTDSKENGPDSLVYKKYGGNKMGKIVFEISRVNSPLVQSLISHEVSKRGWGPKLYGLFDSGRIEEYVDSRVLLASEAFEEQMASHVAKAYARFHSLDLPLEKLSCNPVALARQSFLSKRSLFQKKIDSALAKKKAREPYQALLYSPFREGFTGFFSGLRESFFTQRPLSQKRMDPAIAEEKGFQSFQALLNFPFEEEYTWVFSVVEKIDHRKAFCSIYPNYLNRLVLNDETVEHRCFIIDYDLSCWCDRGFDLGAHFVFRLINAEDHDNLSGAPYPSRKEQRYFLARYLEEASKLFHDFDPDGMDNVDHLQLETDIYALVVLLGIFYTQCHLYEFHETEANAHRFIDCVMQLYRKLEYEFYANNPELVSN